MEYHDRMTETNISYDNKTMEIRPESALDSSKQTLNQCYDLICRLREENAFLKNQLAGFNEMINEFGRNVL